MSVGKALMGGSFWGIAFTVTRMAMSLVSVPLAIDYLGNERYGLWMTALSVMAFITFLDMGLVPILLNRMSEAFAVDDEASFRYYSSSGILIGFMILIFGCIVSGLLPFLDWAALLNIHTSAAKKEVAALVCCLSFISFATLGLGVVDNIYAARMELAKPKRYATIASLLGFVFFLIAIWLQAGLALLASLSLISGVLYRVVLLAELVLKDRRLVLFDFSHLPAVFKELVPVSILFMGIQGANVIMSSSPNILIARHSGMANVAEFSICNRFYNIPIFIISGILPAFWPVFTMAWKRKDTAWLKKWISLALGGSFFLLTLFTVLTVFWGHHVIRWWTLGKIDVSYMLLLTMGGWMIIQCLSNWLTTFLHSITDFKFELVCHAVSAGATITMGYFLGIRYGVTGIAAAMCFSLAAGNVLPMMYRTVVKLNEREKEAGDPAKGIL